MVVVMAKILREVLSLILYSHAESDVFFIVSRRQRRCCVRVNGYLCTMFIGVSRRAWGCNTACPEVGEALSDLVQTP